MRDIKFRAWSKDCKEMIQMAQLLLVNRFDKILKSEDKTHIIMQFTGCKDKNGVEIYEGDIVKFSEYYIGDYRQFEDIEEIKFEGSGFNDNLNVGYADCPEWCEVIGNIYENKELLQ